MSKRYKNERNFFLSHDPSASVNYMDRTAGEIYVVYVPMW